MNKGLKAKSTNLNMYCCMYTDCTSEYSTKFNLRRHVESVHMHVKRFKCPVCFVLFSSKQSLKEHIHLHTGAMPFKCNYCSKLFRQASQLSLHMRLHLAEGKKSDYGIEKLDENAEEIKPIDICMTVDEEKFRLPKIGSERTGKFELPWVF